MKHSLKLRLRRLSSSNKLFLTVYKNMSKIKCFLMRGIDDEEFLKRKFKENTGKELDLRNPKTFNEKLQWLKLYYHKPEFTIMADKLGVRDFVKEKLGNEILLTELYGVYSSFDEIDFNLLPNQFVLKCTHDCGSIVICKDKSKLDMSKARRILEGGLKHNYFYVGREWPYKNIKPRIIAEEYLKDDSKDNLENFIPVLNAWKIFCFDGEPKLLCYTTDKPPDIRQNYFNINFEPVDLSIGFKTSDVPITKPINFDKMLYFASILSKNMPFIRVDLYNISGRIYFNELTFYNWGGIAKYEPFQWDLMMGDWLKLPEPCCIKD